MLAPFGRLRRERKQLNQQQLLLRLFRRHLWPRFAQIHIDLAANAKAACEVDTRLDREPDAGNERSLIRRLEIVEMRTRSMQIAIDRVSGAMHEIVPEPRGADYTARRVVKCS